MLTLSILYNSHNTSVALTRNHKILFAASNERYTRKKMDSSIPISAIKACFRECNINASDLDEVVFVSDPFPKSLLEYFKWYTLPFVKTKGKFLLWIKNPVWLIKILLSGTVIPFYIASELYPIVRIMWELRGYRGKYVFVPHHESHLYSAYYTSGWKKCIVACFEGAGFTKSVSLYYVENNNWKKLVESSIPDSPGYFYQLVTSILGFKPLRHEGKITGLSAYGSPLKAYKFVESLMCIKDGKLKMNYDLYLKTHFYYQINKKLPPGLRKYKREDLAAAFQKRLEDCLTEIIKNALSGYKVDKIALAGGVVANVKLNQRIREIKGVKEIYIHPGMGDEGIALGAALHQTKTFVKFNNLYFGSSYSNKEVLTAIKKYKVNYKSLKNIEKEIAKLIAEGKVVARFLGRMEYGPRALGNRSILCRATDPTINATLNKKLKRTEFMPFAPVVMKHLSLKLFKNLKGSEYTAGFMTITFDCTNYMKKKCPAVVHVDSTARPQIISRSQNPSYHKILSEYYKLTGIPAIINTSFNMHEEPIVCTPDDALRSFTTGELDYLAIDNYLVWVE